MTMWVYNTLYTIIEWTRDLFNYLLDVTGIKPFYILMIIICLSVRFLLAPFLGQLLFSGSDFSSKFQPYKGKGIASRRGISAYTSRNRASLPSGSSDSAPKRISRR